MPANHTEIEKKLWASADELRANSHLKSSECSVPVLGLIFLRFADQRFAHVEQELNATVGYRGGHLRQNLRILPGQVRHVRGTEGRRILHAYLHRQTDRRDHRTLSGAYL